MAGSVTDAMLVLDVGKSNTRVVVLDGEDGTERVVASRANRTVPNGAFRELDVRTTEAWLFDVLGAMPERERIGAIVPVAHGAAMAMLDADGAVLAAPDYEDPFFDRDRALYDARRDPWARILSPPLPLGLNLGRQIDAVSRHSSTLFGRVRTILPLAQYWAFVLSGVAATEVTSLGCHTDLWCPAEARFSPLADREGWAALFPPIRHAADVLGPVRPSLARRFGFSARCAVLCGIHDSNASWYRHRVARGADERFSVVSSGTWTIILSSGTKPERLRAERDMLANVDATGAAVGTARFMGGREYEAVAGAVADGAGAVPDERALARALGSGVVVFPCFAPGGQFIGRTGRIAGAATLDAAAQAALATFYVALLASHALDLLGAEGDIVVDGPLGRNELFASLLATLRLSDPVLAGGHGGGGPAGGAFALRAGRPPSAGAPMRAPPLANPGQVADAASRWRRAWTSPCDTDRNGSST